MEAIRCINTRRSTRDFSSKKVDEEIVKQILNAAINSPSSRDCQPWHFIIVTDQEIKQKLSDLKDPNKRGHILGAPVLIIVCVNKEKSPHLWKEDGAIAALNILLSAHDLGLGAVYVTAFGSTDPELTNKIRAIMDIPAEVMPVVMIPLGYASPDAKIEPKELPNLDDITHNERW